MFKLIKKIYGKTVYDHVERITEFFFFCEEQGFRKGTGCVDHIFTLRQEKDPKKQKKV